MYRECPACCGIKLIRNTKKLKLPAGDRSTSFWYSHFRYYECVICSMSWSPGELDAAAKLVLHKRGANRSWHRGKRYKRKL